MNNTATIHITDEVNVKILGLTPADYTALSDRFAVFAKGYRFQAKFKLGIWDGKISFCSKNGATYVKLLPEVIRFLREYEYGIKLRDDRRDYDLTIPAIDKNYLKDKGIVDEDGELVILGEHQVRGVNALTESNGIFEGGTGAGKTLMTAVLCSLYEENLGYKCITIVPTSDLVEQTRDELELFGVDVGQYSGDAKDINHQHLVSTWQSLQNNRGLIGQYQVVIVDECHGVTGEVLREILNEHGANCRVKLGLTGTLPEEEIDLMAVNITLGEVVEKVEASELIASGWLAKLYLRTYRLVEDVREEYHDFCERNPEKAHEISYTQFKNGMHTDYNAEKKYIQQKPERLDFLARMISAPDNHTLVLVPNVEFGRKISKLIPGAVFFYGKDSKKIRKEIYNSFQQDEQVIAITTYKLASTGLNIKRIFNLFLIDAGKSFVEVIQSIGRGLRKGKGKTSVRVYDVHSDFKFSKRHATSRKKHYKKKNYAYKDDSIDYLEMTL